MDKVKILVACHKPAEVYRDNVYTPIHVGRAVSKCTDKMQDMIGDDTGDNISAKNPFYSELTAQYWLWKNIHDVEYVGLCHYRRYFKHLITENNIDDILGDHYDVLEIKPLREEIDMVNRLMSWTSREDTYIFVKCFEKMHPEDYRTFCHFLYGHKIVPYNMFLMKNFLFDDFAKWQFDVLFEMEKYVRLSQYSRQRRLYGYFSEMLLPIYIEARHLRVKYDDMITYPETGEIWPTYTLKQRLRMIWSQLFLRMAHPHLLHKEPKEYQFDFNAVEVGMKQDGIIIK